MDKLTRRPHPDVSSEPGPDDRPKVGQWYWVTGKDWQGKVENWFGCVVEVGSNYAKLEHPQHASERVHFDVFHERCTLEPDADAVIAKHIQDRQGLVRELMGNVEELTRLLGVGPQQQHVEPETEALVVAAGNRVEEYKTALVKAQQTTLPELFKQIREQNEALAAWMTASTLPMQAQAKALEQSLGVIKDRIFHVELYAGLTEQVEQIADGEPAAVDTPLHLMQRRHYMDEESLISYEAGGLDFNGLDSFDRWLAKPKNRDRILPFPRCVVAFRVRRETKEREVESLADWVRFTLEKDADKLTFLYLRNGDKLFRLGTAVEFDEKLFPDLDRSQLTGKIYARLFANSVDRIFTEGEYLEMMRERDEGIRAREAAPKKERWHLHVPYEHDRFAEFTPNDLRYDDISKYLGAQMKQHNRIVLILQGLLDRSPVFHPHPRWRIGTPEGFSQALRLVFDKDRALVRGPPPDFEAYRARLNESLHDGSMTIGQEDAWELVEGAKETERISRNSHRPYTVLRSRPYGDPGPGLIAPVAHYSAKNKTCTFRWERERLRRQWSDQSEKLPRSFTTSTSRLLNLDAYTPGDFRQFFDDPRTRLDYLKWAPLLLPAEDFKAGKTTKREE